MKLSGFPLVILMIGLVFAIVGSIIVDFETQYPEIDVNSTWEDDYDYQEQISSNATVLSNLILRMQDEDTGWVLKTLLGAAVVPIAVITALVVSVQSLGIGVRILTDIGKEITMPIFVITFAITALTVVIVWAVLSWWRRSKG